MKIIAGKYKNLSLKSPKGSKTRPTLSKVRQSVFNIIQNEIEGARFLDLFAGSGAMGCEALSRGASTVTFVEKDFAAIQCIKDNLQKLGEKGTILKADAQAALKKIEGPFDILYIDPPYDLNIHPLLELLPPLMHEESLALLEQSKRTPIQTPHLIQVDERNFGDTTLFFFKKLQNIP